MSSPAAVRGSDAVKAALIESAAEMLAEVGPSALSIREVARRAGVNHGQVHHYFGGKGPLLRAAMKHLAEEHWEHATRLAGGGAIPPALSLMEDTSYWRAVCRVVMEGDMELARVEVDEGISVPRRAMAEIREQRGAAEDDLDFKAQCAALAALQLGWAAFEDFMLVLVDVEEKDREALRSRVKQLLEHFVEPARLAGKA